MKTGLTLQQMASEIERRNNAKRDFIADTKRLEVDVPVVGSQTPRIWLDMPHTEPVRGLVKSNAIQLELGDNFRRQVTSHYKIPSEYAERILTAHPALYASTLNTFFRNEPARRMVRTLDNKARAFLSDRYRPLDDYDLSQAVLPELMNHKDLSVESTQFTDDRMYIKAVSPRIQTEVKVGDPVQIGIVISNSEVGAGSLQVVPMIYRLVCRNGMISSDYGQRRYHVGKRADATESAFELYSDDTRRLDDAAFFAKVRDTVKGVLTHDVLGKLTAKLREATETKIESKDIPAVVEVTAKTFGYGETTKAGILQHLIQGGDLSRYGLMNAITRQSQDEESYETATRLEMDGGRLIELPKVDWQRIAKAELAKAA